MYIKNITDSEVLPLNAKGSFVAPSKFYDIPDESTDLEMFQEIEGYIENDKALVSLNKIELFTKEESKRYIYYHYTIDKEEYLIYDRVGGHARFKDIDELNWDVDLFESLYWKYTHKFGRKIRKVGYWYNNGNPDFSTPVLRIDYNFSFNVAGLTSAIERRISYYKRDGSLESDVKKAVEVYNSLQTGTEQRERRELIYAEIKAIAQAALIGSGQYSADDIEFITGTFVIAIQPMIDGYIENGLYNLVDLLRNNTVPQIETELGLSDLSFLSFTYNNAPFKDTFVDLLDYRSAEAVTAPDILYSGSSL